MASTQNFTINVPKYKKDPGKYADEFLKGFLKMNVQEQKTLKKDFRRALSSVLPGQQDVALMSDKGSAAACEIKQSTKDRVCSDLNTCQSCWTDIVPLLEFIFSDKSQYTQQVQEREWLDNFTTKLLLFIDTVHDFGHEKDGQYICVNRNNIISIVVDNLNGLLDNFSMKYPQIFSTIFKQGSALHTMFTAENVFTSKMFAQEFETEIINTLFSIKNQEIMSNINFDFFNPSLLNPTNPPVKTALDTFKYVNRLNGLGWCIDALGFKERYLINNILDSTSRVYLITSLFDGSLENSPKGMQVIKNITNTHKNKAPSNFSIPLLSLEDTDFVEYKYDSNITSVINPVISRKFPPKYGEGKTVGLGTDKEKSCTCIQGTPPSNKCDTSGKCPWLRIDKILAGYNGDSTQLYDSISNVIELAHTEMNKQANPTNPITFANALQIIRDKTEFCNALEAKLKKLTGDEVTKATELISDLRNSWYVDLFDKQSQKIFESMEFFITLKALGDFAQSNEAKKRECVLITADRMMFVIGCKIGAKIMLGNPENWQTPNSKPKYIPDLNSNHTTSNGTSTKSKWPQPHKFYVSKQLYDYLQLPFQQSQNEEKQATDLLVEFSKKMSVYKQTIDTGTSTSIKPELKLDYPQGYTPPSQPVSEAVKLNELIQQNKDETDKVDKALKALNSNIGFYKDPNKITVKGGVIAIFENYKGQIDKSVKDKDKLKINHYDYTETALSNFKNAFISTIMSYTSTKQPQSVFDSEFTSGNISNTLSDLSDAYNYFNNYYKYRTIPSDIPAQQAVITNLLNFYIIVVSRILIFRYKESIFLNNLLGIVTHAHSNVIQQQNDIGTIEANITAKLNDLKEIYKKCLQTKREEFQTERKLSETSRTKRLKEVESIRETWKKEIPVTEQMTIQDLTQLADNYTSVENELYTELKTLYDNIEVNDKKIESAIDLNPFDKNLLTFEKDLDVKNNIIITDKEKEWKRTLYNKQEEIRYLEWKDKEGQGPRKRKEGRDLPRDTGYRPSYNYYGNQMEH